VKIQDHILGLDALDGDLQTSDTSYLNRVLLHIGRDRNLCHQFAEGGPQCLDVCSWVELSLAQDGIELVLLLRAHQIVSLLGVGWRETAPR
jgi:hypothetical protein